MLKGHIDDRKESLVVEQTARPIERGACGEEYEALVAQSIVALIVDGAVWMAHMVGLAARAVRWMARMVWGAVRFGLFGGTE